MPRLRMLVLPLVALPLLVAACAGAGGPVDAAGERGPVVSAPVVPVPSDADAGGDARVPVTGPPGETPEAAKGAVPAILRFETPLVGSGSLRGAELAGAPVALWFWAPW